MPVSAVGEFGFIAPGVAVVIGADHHEVAGLAEHIQGAAGGEGTCMAESEFAARRPGAALVIGDQDASAFRDPMLFASRLSSEIEGRDQASIVESGDAGSVAIDAVGIGRFIDDHVIVGQGAHRLPVGFGGKE